MLLVLCCSLNKIMRETIPRRSSVTATGTRLAGELIFPSPSPTPLPPPHPHLCPQPRPRAICVSQRGVSTARFKRTRNTDFYLKLLICCKYLPLLKNKHKTKKGPRSQRALLCAERAESGCHCGPRVSAALPTTPSAQGDNTLLGGGTPRSGKSLSLNTGVPCALGTNGAN